MKYKVGDIVRVRDDLKGGAVYGGRSFNVFMEPVRGKKVKILSSGECGYWIEGDCKGLCFTDEMLEPVDAPDTNVGTLSKTGEIEAKKCVCGKRKEDYGELEDNFTAVGRFWEEYLRDKCVSGCAEISVNAEDVAAMMILLKVARIKTGNGGKDSWVDVAGYAACGGEIAERKY